MGVYINENDVKTKLNELVSAHSNNFKIVQHRRKRASDMSWKITFALVLPYGDVKNEEIYRFLMLTEAEHNLKVIGSEPRLEERTPEEYLLVEVEIGLA